MLPRPLLAPVSSAHPSPLLLQAPPPPTILLQGGRYRLLPATRLQPATQPLAIQCSSDERAAHRKEGQQAELTIRPYRWNSDEGLTGATVSLEAAYRHGSAMAPCGAPSCLSTSSSHGAGSDSLGIPEALGSGIPGYRYMRWTNK